MFENLWKILPITNGTADPLGMCLIIYNMK